MRMGAQPTPGTATLETVRRGTRAAGRGAQGGGGAARPATGADARRAYNARRGHAARDAQTRRMSIWFRTPDLAQLNAFNANTLSGYLDMQITACGDDWLEGTMPVNERTVQPFGLLHGGASVVLAETLGSHAANLCLDRSRYSAVGQEINANHLRAVRSGIVTG